MLGDKNMAAAFVFELFHVKNVGLTLRVALGIKTK